jgi:hypothetical protein
MHIPEPQTSAPEPGQKKYERKKHERRAKKEERYSVSFSVALGWVDKSGLVRRINARCVDLSPEGMKIETRDRVDAGTVVAVQSDEFGRMGHATVRHVQRDKMQCVIGLKFGAAFGLGDPARKKILEQVLRSDGASGDI